MRLFIIGRLFEGKKVVAYKIYNANEKKAGIYSRDNVYMEVKKGIHVTGLRLNTNGTISGLFSSFNVAKTDKVNGKGEPINDKGNYILIGIDGFLEATEYRLVNSRGDEKIVLQEEFETMVDGGKINGAARSTRIKDKIVIYRDCGHREYSSMNK